MVTSFNKKKICQDFCIVTIIMSCTAFAVSKYKSLH